MCSAGSCECVFGGGHFHTYVRTYVCTCVHTCAQVCVGVGGCALVRMGLVVGAGVAVGGCGSGVCAWVWVRMRVCVGGWLSGAWVGAGVVGCGWVWIGVGVSAHMSVAVHGSSCVHILLVALVRYIPRFLLRLGATMPSQFGPRASLVHCGGSGWCTMCHNAYSSSAFYFNLDCDVFIVLFFHSDHRICATHHLDGLQSHTQPSDNRFLATGQAIRHKRGQGQPRTYVD